MSDQLVELETLLPKLGAAVEQRQIGDNLGRAADRLKDSDKLIGRLKAVLDIARDTNFNLDTGQAEALEELVEEARYLANGLENARTADNLHDIADSYSDFVNSLARVDRQLRTHWRALASRDFKPLIAIGNLLTQLDVEADLGRRLMECGREATEVRDSISAEALRDTVIRVRNKRHELDEERVAFTSDAEVDEFLIALAEGRATLRLVTASVRSWLEENDALDSFDILPTS
ncbi:hypothetical protein [Roseibium marinum]|uniref:Uncharacterized protein n=1 Tax=Roseibium marinum TaxID=281252 RepID=A0A2S3UY08_9HYPH|nr:hypothetical protein [Roseibium marinum]POF32612.1 hypothetical protein CLV41_10214 [Roseibium marinum]